MFSRVMAAVFHNKRTGKNKVAPVPQEVPLVVPTESTPVYTTPPPSPCASMAPTRESTPTRGVSLATLLSVPSLMERVKVTDVPGTGPEVSIGDFDDEPEHPYFSVAPDAVQLRFIIHKTKGEFSYEGVIASKYQGNYGNVMNPMDSDDETSAPGDCEFSNIVPDTQ